MKLNLVSCELQMNIGGSPVVKFVDAEGTEGFYIYDVSVDSIASGTNGTLYHWYVEPGKGIGMGRKAAVVDKFYGAEQMIDMIKQTCSWL